MSEVERPPLRGTNMHGRSRKDIAQREKRARVRIRISKLKKKVERPSKRHEKCIGAPKKSQSAEWMHARTCKRKPRNKDPS